jgi:hypothetical protein
MIACEALAATFPLQTRYQAFAESGCLDIQRYVPGCSAGDEFFARVSSGFRVLPGRVMSRNHFRIRDYDAGVSSSGVLAPWMGLSGGPRRVA